MAFFTIIIYFLKYVFTFIVKNVIIVIIADNYTQTYFSSKTKLI